jgi:hypothetical protein
MHHAAEIVIPLPLRALSAITGCDNHPKQCPMENAGFQDTLAGEDNSIRRDS